MTINIQLSATFRVKHISRSTLNKIRDLFSFLKKIFPRLALCRSDLRLGVSFKLTVRTDSLANN